jgi:hypothetical protein
MITNTSKLRHKEELRSHSTVGGYPLWYLQEIDKKGWSCRTLCPTCANNLCQEEPVWLIECVNYESELYCDECSEKIESAY